ncbi:cytochrome c biogenesis CcdA family protein [Cognatishimia sp. SS12]|uniref:cytochrome c biogenesis CcdA family protein n=1 Tax=Cognatishimia sp. SS12 TaxID=2979465 RepID=UPI00232F7157|nr:cytochrome c biogenesis CcdA family protein [Cognatishimia sp. SS12]MDC0737808.1 cytochrome c biogenesis CcdA family protein [Cognatishimia sp. SS12]
MEFIFAYLAGLLTLINPCVVPVLPIVLATALQASPRGPLLLAAGMSLSFVVLGMAVTTLGYTLGISVDDLAQAGALMMIGFGAILLIPQLSARFASATAGVSARADGQLNHVDPARSSGQFVSGLLLGAVWSPCIGPTLGGAIALASQGESLARAATIMGFFALGVSTLILALGYGARGFLVNRRATMQKLALIARPVMGGVFVLVGLALFLGWHHVIEAWLLDHMPLWLLDLSVSL